MITLLDQETPDDIAEVLAQRVRMRRKEQKLTQAQLSRKAGGSLKRFEHDHQISLQSLIKLSIALGCESDFSELFSKKGYSSIQEVLDER